VAIFRPKPPAPDYSRAGANRNFSRTPATDSQSFRSEIQRQIPVFGEQSPGLVPAPTTASGWFLRDDGTWVAGAGGGAPTTVDYLVRTADAGLSAERVVTDTASIIWDWSTGGQSKAERAALTGHVTASQNSNSTTIASGVVTDTHVAAANKDGVAGTASMRTLGTGAQQACAGDDSRLSDDRTASGLRTASTVVSVSAASAPTSGQVLTATGGTAATWQTPAGGSGHTIQDEGTPLTARANLNFVGGRIEATDDSGAGATKVTVSTPTGTGFAHITSDAEDAAAIKVDLAENGTPGHVTGVLDETNGGTGQSTLTKGDLIYANAANTFAKLGIGASDTVLMTDATGLPAWTMLLTKISGSSGAAGNYMTWQTLSSNAAANATTTVAAVMTTTGVGSGTWAFKYLIRYQSSVTTTGVFFSIDHGGTVSMMVYHMTFVSTGGAAATGVADQVSGTNAGQLVEGKSARTDNATVAGGHTASAGVDTINADCLMVLEGIFTCSTSGSLILNHASETANSTQVMAGTTLELRKVA